MMLHVNLIQGNHCMGILVLSVAFTLPVCLFNNRHLFFMRINYIFMRINYIDLEIALNYIFIFLYILSLLHMLKSIRVHLPTEVVAVE